MEVEVEVEVVLVLVLCKVLCKVAALRVVVVVIDVKEDEELGGVGAEAALVASEGGVNPAGKNEERLLVGALEVLV